MFHNIMQLLAGLLLSSALVQAMPAEDVSDAADGVHAVKVGSTITIRATTKSFKNFYLMHNGTDVDIRPITSANTTAQKQTAMWKVVAPLNSTATNCVSFESVDVPGNYIRHFAFELYSEPLTGGIFVNDGTWCPQSGFAKHGTTSFQSLNYPDRYMRHYAEVGYAASKGGPETFDAASHFNHDASWKVGSGF